MQRGTSRRDTGRHRTLQAAAAGGGDLPRVRFDGRGRSRDADQDPPADARRPRPAQPHTAPATGAPRWRRSPSPRRSARRTCRRCRSASRRSAREARAARRHGLRRLREVAAERVLRHSAAACSPARASRRSTCAASPAAATATTPARSRASACTWTSSRSPRSRARSTSTSTTSPASRRSPARRARCTARAREAGTLRIITNKPDPSGVRGRLRRRSQRDRRRRHRLRGRRLRQRAAGDERRGAPGGLGEARRRLHRQRAGHAHVPDLGHRRMNNDRAGARTTTTRPTPRRARGAEDRPQRQLVDHADVMGQQPDGQRQHRLRSERRRPGGQPLLSRSLRRPLDPGGADRRGQDRQLRPHLRLRAPQARRRHGSRLQRLRFWYDTLSRLRRVLLRRRRQRSIESVAVHPGEGRLHQDQPRAAHRLAGGQSPALRRRPVLAAAEARHRAALPHRRPRADRCRVTGWPDTIWLTEQDRIDQDEAVFGELTFDITDAGSVTAGGRWFRTEQQPGGLLRLRRGYSLEAGVRRTAKPRAASVGATAPTGPYEGAPCIDLRQDRRRRAGSLGRVNLTWQFTTTKMVYATWSEGFRPGGINRRGTLPPYQSDFLKNYELGWKTDWLDNRLAWNGAVFREDWNDFQFSVLGANGLTEIRNAAQGAHRRPGNGLQLGGDLQPAAHRRLRVLRRQADGELLRLHRSARQPDHGLPGGQIDRRQIDDPGRPAGAGGHAPADHRALQGQPDGRATPGTWGRRGLRAGRGVPPGRPPRRPARMRNGIARRPDAYTLAGPVGGLPARHLVDGLLPQERDERNRANSRSSPSARSKPAAASRTPWARRRGRSGCGGRGISDAVMRDVRKGRREPALVSSGYTRRIAHGTCP